MSMAALLPTNPVIKDSLITDGVNHPEIPDGSPVIYIDLDFMDAHKTATDSRFAVRDGLNERRW